MLATNIGRHGRGLACLNLMKEANLKFEVINGKTRYRKAPL
jgi:hypothetical protein